VKGHISCRTKARLRTLNGYYLGSNRCHLWFSAFQANYFIFEKLKQEGFSGNDDVRLRTAITVPRNMVGRVIGKAGKNVSVVAHVRYYHDSC